MKPSHLVISLVAALALGACGAPSKSMAPADPASKGGAPAGATAPGAPAPDTATPGAAPEGAATDGAAVGGAPAATGAGAAPAEKKASRSTSPTNDTGPTGDSATTPPAGSRLEDYKGTKSSGSSGSYSVAVRSAAGLVPDEVGKAVNGAAPKTDACYTKAIKKKPAAGSATLFEVNVDTKGKGAIKLVTDTLKDSEWTKCVEAALKEVSWPKPTEKTGKTTVEFTVGG